MITSLPSQSSIVHSNEAPKPTSFASIAGIVTLILLGTTIIGLPIAALIGVIWYCVHNQNASTPQKEATSTLASRYTAVSPSHTSSMQPDIESGSQSTKAPAATEPDVTLQSSNPAAIHSDLSSEVVDSSISSLAARINAVSQHVFSDEDAQALYSDATASKPQFKIKNVHVIRLYHYETNQPILALIEKRLGQGAGSRVYKVTTIKTSSPDLSEHWSVKSEALKVDIPGTNQGVLSVEERKRKHIISQHPNLEKNADYFGRCDNYRCALYELADGDLEAYGQSFDITKNRTTFDRPRTILHVGLDVLKGLNHLHNPTDGTKPKAHRDIKPANLLFKRTEYGKIHVIVADLGFLTLQGSIYGRQQGSPLFMPGESRLPKTPSRPFMDVYAFGITLLGFTQKYLRMQAERQKTKLNDAQLQALIDHHPNGQSEQLIQINNRVPRRLQNKIAETMMKKSEYMEIVRTLNQGDNEAICDLETLYDLSRSIIGTAQERTTYTTAPTTQQLIDLLEGYLNPTIPSI